LIFWSGKNVKLLVLPKIPEDMRIYLKLSTMLRVRISCIIKTQWPYSWPYYKYPRVLTSLVHVCSSSRRYSNDSEVSMYIILPSSNLCIYTTQHQKLERPREAVVVFFALVPVPVPAHGDHHHSVKTRKKKQKRANQTYEVGRVDMDVRLLLP